MSRISTVVWFVCSVVLVGIGAFYTGNYVGSPPTNTENIQTDIILEAKKRLPPPVIPSKPAGREEIRDVIVTKQVPVPTTTFQTIKLPFGVSTKIPTQSVEFKTISETVKQPVFVEATAEENKAWEAEVARLQNDYDNKLEAEIQKVVMERRLDYAKQLTALAKQIVQDIMIPLLASLAGLIGAIIALRKAFRMPTSA